MPISAVITAESGEDDKGYEIYLNRSGINSIEIPRGRIQVEVGGQLRLR